MDKTTATRPLLEVLEEHVAQIKAERAAVLDHARDYIAQEHA